MVNKYEADVEEQAFTFQYTREGKEPRWIRVYSSHVSSFFNLFYFISYNCTNQQYLYMERCVERVKDELKWKKVCLIFFLMYRCLALTDSLSLSLSFSPLFSSIAGCLHWIYE